MEEVVARMKSRTTIIANQLLRWFANNRRNFPWRNTFGDPDPYLILFTEIMLHRTRAEQVVPFYLDFVKRYPTFSVLRKAAPKEIYQFYSRLGLNWRARNVVRLVHTLDLNFDGVIPRTIDRMKLLP